MNDHVFGILYPIWIGIGLNMIFVLFNMVGMAVGLKGRFVDWYLGNAYESAIHAGAFKLMFGSWAVLIAWSTFNGLTRQRLISKSEKEKPMLYDPKWEHAIPAETQEPWRKVLLDAAALIEQRGHCKMRTHDSEGRLCFWGAICVASHGQPYGEGPYDDSNPAWLAHNRAMAFLGNRSPVDFNNEIGTTKNDVITMMRHAANA